MPRDSDREYFSKSRRAHNGVDSRSRNSRSDSERQYDDGPSRRGDRVSNYRRTEEARYGYGEEERERERRRDRERYDRDGDHNRDRDRDYHESQRSSRRRSESPHSRSSRPRSRSRSASPVNKAKPNFGASGLLAAETNTVQSIDGKNSTVLKYNEPPEARKPVLGWRLYVFKGEEQVELLHIQRQSAYLIGRDRLVADIPIEHPSCSKQHASVFSNSSHHHDQVKTTHKLTAHSIRPFIIDLESTNGTHVNDNKIPASRYYELKLNDVIKFGTSNREYVLLHDDAS
ncbi:SMAD/FHA domain-containing protein [Lentinula lateritia]|uniref:SMAD/FHA domain-containing protein n=1 Tax=Lentinula aff. lateritia TaxID=2804960 RepID=A0ACC1TUK7_9AGAR|nr:SMAD/FHA domain-containing protein [Lentinula aff. lateritia]KAJ3855963.1 SMAD/FHA domain-containing protein [Lentinula lateritia]